VRTFETPERAARGELREEYVRVVGVVIRGEEAVVAQVMNADGYPDGYEVETVECFQEGDGWVAGNSGNNNLTLMRTSDERGTVVWWGEAAEGATAARVRVGEEEQIFNVRDGFLFVVFDDVPYQEARIEDFFPPLPDGHGGYVWRVKRTPEERRALLAAMRGFEGPEVVEWMYATGDS
jgi:hypothetical protein